MNLRQNICTLNPSASPDFPAAWQILTHAWWLFHQYSDGSLLVHGSVVLLCLLPPHWNQAWPGVSQPQHCWHFGLAKLLSWVAVLCIAGCLAVALAFAHLIPSSTLPPTSPFQLWQSKISLDVAKSPLRDSFFLVENHWRGHLTLANQMWTEVIAFKRQYVSYPIFPPPFKDIGSDEAFVILIPERC